MEERTLTIANETGQIVGVDDAWERHKRIVALRHKAECTFLELGAELYEFCQNREGQTGWEALGHTSFNSYLADPEVDIGRRTAFRLIRVHTHLVLGLRSATVALLPVGIVKADCLAAHVKKGNIDESNLDEWLDKAATLSRSDLRDEIRRVFSAPTMTSAEVVSEILIGSIDNVGERISGQSVDLILTDPPYEESKLSLFSSLSSLAAKVLKSGGLCLTYSGQVFLPEAMKRLGEHLEYAWTFAVRHTGGNTRIYKVNVNNGWKPVLAYCKSPLNPWWDSFIDITTGGREKELHDWQQAESEAAYFIEHLSLPGSVVLDPFAGSGTVLVAAKKLGRRYLGIEIDTETASIASKRLEEIDDAQALG